MNLVVLFRGRQEKLLDYQEGRKVIDSNIDFFVLPVAVTKQKAVQSIDFSTARRNFEREKEVEDTMLDLLKLVTEGLQERTAYSSTPTAGGHRAHGVVEERSPSEKLHSVSTDAGRCFGKVHQEQERYPRFPTKRKPQCVVHSLSERPQVGRLSADKSNACKVSNKTKEALNF